MNGQLGALVATHLSDRRRSLLAWGLPIGLMSFKVRLPRRPAAQM